ncbi:MULTISPECIES: hypothetical protein [Enterococcaceae]|uniref:DUF3784 domain-containing protein n=1 Tax=Vagococcus luciliae TaxID=2920380 RepID=A0ABY5NX68_9ENTE|nr:MULTISPECIES: hypothetical protein [Enterococcaceae]MCI0130428.1 hypothetical protein [Vagococcus sp. CY53-2]RGI32156.1 hypothetical protein DXC12_02310 [Melissococcus sp. OM08-11BH]UNM89863.1 hypothetical protein MN187_01860 [Vagococcus sp. CY52-2]UUV98031.1 hypothetical protein G314FT_01220 [Vagococcus luciliae]
MNLIIQIVTLLIIFVSMFIYYRQVSKAKKNQLGLEVLAKSSQLTMSGFILGLGVILTELNSFGLSRSEFVNHLLIYGAFVSLVTIISIWYYSRTLKK